MACVPFLESLSVELPFSVVSRPQGSMHDSALASLLSVMVLASFAPVVFLVGYVEERLWWPIQSPNIGRKKKANS